MARKHVLTLVALLMSAAIGQTQFTAWGHTQQASAEQQLSIQQIKPKWNVGDEWVVSAVTAQRQVSHRTEAKPSTTMILWRFRVAALEQLGKHNCYRIEVRAVEAPKAHPMVVLWADAETLTLRHFQTQLPVQGQYRTVAENYEVSQGKAAPILPPMTALPVDLPAFVSNDDKALGGFSYESRSGDVTTKNLGTLSFRTDVQQTISTPDVDSVNKMLGNEFSKSLETNPLLRIELTTSDRKVQQYWQQNQPWPIFADNGQTQARLVSFTPAGENTQPEESKSTSDDRVDDREGNKQTPQASENRDQGTARFKPWSGYWWPIREGRIVEPLTKYDRLTQHTAADWEREHHPAEPDIPSWHGYCHAWAASAVMEKEPQKTVLPQSSSPVQLTIGDQKGLLAACHTSDVANSYGDRFGDDLGSEDKQDLAPETLWHLLTIYVQQQGVPLILDIEAGPEVWNYPVYAYEVEYQPRGNSGKQVAKLTLLMADNGVAPDYRGLKVRRQTYRFSFVRKNGAIVKGSGKWLGRSRQDHPDFAWYPYIAVAENPEIIYTTIKKLVSAADVVEVASRPESPEYSNLPGSAPEETTDPAPRPATPPNHPSPSGQQNDPRHPVVLSPMELVALVINKSSSFGFDVTVDRFDGGIYEIGDRMQVRCTSEKAGYLYLIQIDAVGQPALLFPQRGQNNWIEAQESVVIPSATLKQGFQIQAPQGTTRIRAVVSTRPLLFSGTVHNGSSAQRPDSSQPQAPVDFRLHPTQQQQVQDALSHQQSTTAEELLRTITPIALLGQFAQDEVKYYVDKPKKSSIQQQNSGRKAPGAR